MLTSRNVIALTISLAVISLLWSCWSLLRPPDGDGLRSDSFGTKGRGQRAIFDTFCELGLPIRRSLEPPIPDKLGNARLVLWRPADDIVRGEPVWLEAVGNWVQAGGRVLVAVGVEEQDWLSKAAAEADASRRSRKKKSDDTATVVASRSLWELLHLPNVSVTTPRSGSGSSVSSTAPRRRSSPDLREIFREAMATGATTTEHRVLTAHASGVFDSVIGTSKKLSLPTVGLFEIQYRDHTPIGTVMVDADVANIADAKSSEAEAESETEAEAERNAANTAVCIAARFTVGRGEVTVLSVPALIDNSEIGEADNIVVLAKLLAEDGRDIVVDEFYHGLSIRGNPMWLFAQRTYGSVTLALLLVIGLIAWRESVFLGTPLPERAVSRRAIREYVDAMARFLREGRGTEPWIVAKLRDGVLWHLRREHGLPPEQHSEERLLAAVERRDPDRGAELKVTLQAVSDLLRTGQAGQERRAIPLMRRMVECLSKNATARCATKSRK